jgi:serine/threonine protein kinase
VSNLALSFLKKLLIKDPQLRMTAKEALSHPFLLTMGRNCQSPHRTTDKLNNSFED